MGKIVGKIFIFLCINVVQCITGAISLRLYDIDHMPLKQVGAGCPFLIEVAINDITSVGQSPHIGGLDQFVVKNAGVHITSINGKTVAKYLFQVRIDVPGEYTIGPVYFDNQSKKEEPTTMHIVVGKDKIDECKKNESRKRDQAVLLRLTTDKSRAFVNEQIRCRLRFYYVDPSISLRRLIEQDAKNMRRKKIEGPSVGVEQLYGTSYQYIEWEWDLFPQTPGTCVIPAFGADYEKEVERDDFWGGLGRFLGNHIEAKRIYSNAISVEIDALPDTDQTFAVGEFQSITLTAKPAVAKQGEGIVVAIEIIGKGDLESVCFPELVGIPQTLRFYESKESVIDSGQKDSLTKKRFEFIVQGLHIGTWIIPSQEFYYFDTKQKKFSSLKSAPLTLTIMPDTKKITNKQHEDPPNEVKNEHDATCLIPLHKESWRYSASKVHMPWWLFFIFVCLPVILLVFRSLLRKGFKQQTSYREYRAHNAFKRARSRLAIIKKNKEVHELYKLFVELFADRCKESVTDVSVKTIRHRLQSAGMTAEYIEQWDQFFSSITERAFGVHNIEIDKDLFDKAEAWIQKFQDLL